MKRLTCEMCGGTDLIKQDGVFVCQSCGTKYSVEEAKKMMVEVAGTVEVKNAAQLENLLKLAHSSYDSQNYAQAEEFCNQAIAMDDKTYEAWKLKGQAISALFDSDGNSRMLEMKNCIVTSYSLLSDEDKAANREDLFTFIKESLENDVCYWFNRVEQDRPTNTSVNRAINAYSNAYILLGQSYLDLELSGVMAEVINEFKSFIAFVCNTLCVRTWKSTVAYNYYRDYMGQGVDPFGRPAKAMGWVISQQFYRPTYPIYETFREEGDLLIELLLWAESLFNENTSPDTMESVYENIAYFEECIASSGSWKLEFGYTHNWASEREYGWIEEYCLTDEAKAIRRKRMNEYRTKAKTEVAKAKARQKAAEEKAKQERIAAYWAEHANEKAQLDEELKALKEKIAALDEKIKEINDKNSERLIWLSKERNKELTCEKAVNEQQKLISELEKQRDSLGLFKGKEKKALQERIDTQERPKLQLLKNEAASEKKIHIDNIDRERELIRGEGKEFRIEVEALQKRKKEINDELTKER